MFRLKPRFNNSTQSNMAAFPSQENRPLKKPRLGYHGPDVYPQDPKQKEVSMPVFSVPKFYKNLRSRFETVGRFILIGIVHQSV